MASSSPQEGARAPPPPDQLAVLYSLVDKRVNAAVLCRHARDAELSATAAVIAEALFPGDSLVVAHLRMAESRAFVYLAASANGAERDALSRRSWSALLFVIALLQRRLNTILPGDVRKEEFDYHVHVLVAKCAAKNVSVGP